MYLVVSEFELSAGVRILLRAWGQGQSGPRSFALWRARAAVVCVLLCCVPIVVNAGESLSRHVQPFTLQRHVQFAGCCATVSSNAGRDILSVRNAVPVAISLLVVALALAWAGKYRNLARRLRSENQKRGESELALRKQIEEHRRTMESVSALANLGLQLSAVHTAKEAAEIILSVADRLFGWDSCRLDLYSREKNQLYQILIMDLVDGKRVEFPSTYKHLHPPPLSQDVLDHGAKLILREPKTFLPGAIPFGDQHRPSASLMFVPIRTGAEVRGIATIQSYSLNAYNHDDLTSFQALADHCGGALERLRVQGEREQLIQQLQGALAQVKTLHGLLPICAQCKKIRDDHGYWNQVEVYVRDHSHANFTHSICPDCARQLYPDVYLES